MQFEIDWNAAAISIAVFFGLIIAVLALKRLKIIDSVAFLTLIAVPIAVYGVSTGLVKKIELGGVTAEFEEALNRPPENSATIELGSEAIRETREIESEGGLQLFAKAGIPRLEEIRTSFDPGRPLALTLELGRFGYYSSKAIEIYVNSMLSLDPNTTVIFTDEDNTFGASASGQSLLAASQTPDFEENFVPALENSQLDVLGELITLTRKSATATTSKADVLRMMTDDGVDTIVVVDAGNLPVGIVAREQILSELMLTLAGK